MSDTPRTDSAIYESYVVDTDFARTLERELNAAKKSPWKPLSEIPEALKDGRELLIRSSNTERFSWCMLMSCIGTRDFPWIELSTGDDYRLDDSDTEYMEIPK